MNETFVSRIGGLVLNDSQWAPVNVYHNMTSGIPPSGNLQISTWNGSLGKSDYTYMRYHHDIASINKPVGMALDYYFRPNVFTYPAYCTYPISGQYGFLNRLLFYLLIIFALLARKRTWLAAAALGTAMTYAASAAVHAFALLVRYEYKAVSPQDLFSHSQMFKAEELGDLDLHGIFPILVSGCIMLAPILHWSAEIRENNVRAVAICWGGLVFSALIPTFIRVWKGVIPLIHQGQLVTCDADAAKDCTFDIAMLTSFLSYDFYQKCNCNDTCGAVSLPHAPFRKGQNLQLLLFADKEIKLGDTESWYRAYVTNSFLLCFVICHGILGLWEVNYTQAELRNKIFVFLADTSAYRDRTTLSSKVRYHLARTIALCFFLGAIVGAIISPALFVSTVIVTEIGTWGFPVAERNDAVGQWSTYVGAAFVLIAAVIDRYHLAWRDYLWSTFSEIGRLSVQISRGQNPRYRRGSTKSQSGKNASAVGDGHHSLQPLKHVRQSVSRSWHRVEDELEDFKLWLRDPIYRSKQPHYHCLRSLSIESEPLEGLLLPRAETAPISPASFFTTSYKHSGTEKSSFSTSSTTQLTPLRPVSTAQSYFDEPIPGHTTPRESL